LLRLFGEDSGDCTVKLWDVATGNERTTLKGHTGAVSCVALSDNGKLLASGSAYADEKGKRFLGELKLWDLTTDKEKATFKHTGLVSSLALSPDGKLLAGGICLVATEKPSGEVILWDVPARKKIATLKHTDFVSSVTLSGDGKLLVSGSGDFGSWGGSGFAGTVKLWDILALKKPEK
jgi:WD40 repeat protein